MKISHQAKIIGNWETLKNYEEGQIKIPDENGSKKKTVKMKNLASPARAQLPPSRPQLLSHFQQTGNNSKRV